MSKRSPAKRIAATITEHRRAVCDYRFVWRVAPAHQTAGWRNAALTHERLVRAYTRDLRAQRLTQTEGP